MANLTGAQYERLVEALLSAYPRQQDLVRMVRLKLDRNLHAIVSRGSQRDMVFELIEVSEAEGWTANLVAAAKAQNPGNPDLAAIDFAVAAGARVRESVQLEVMVSPELDFIDLKRWTELLPAIERKVCAVEFSKNHRGTGFLVGPNVVLTNYHVVEKAVASGSADRWSVRFDWGLNPDTSRTEGTQFDFAEDWLLDTSPYSQLDKLMRPSADSPPPTELDYALLRIAEEPTVAAPDAPADRGWIPLTNREHLFDSGTFMMIAQHPCGDEIKMAIDPRAVIELNSSKTRVTYRTNTQPGSSGSPCFDSDLNLIALHHAGLSSDSGWPPPDPCVGDPVTPLHNRGIPTSAIADLIASHGEAGALGGP